MMTRRNYERMAKILDIPGLGTEAEEIRKRIGREMAEAFAADNRFFDHVRFYEMAGMKDNPAPASGRKRP